MGGHVMRLSLDGSTFSTEEDWGEVAHRGARTRWEVFDFLYASFFWVLMMMMIIIQPVTTNNFTHSLPW